MQATGTRNGNRAPQVLAPALAFGGNNTAGPIDVAAGLNAKGGSGRMDFETETFLTVTHTLRAEGCDASEDGTGRGTPLVPVAFSNRGIDADVHETLPAASHGALPMVAHSIGVGIGGEDIGFARRANPSKSGDKGDGGMNVSLALAPGMAVRRLTPTECERLQGFPDGWTAGHSDSTRYRMLGNAVAVPVVEWIGKRIVAASTCDKAD